MIANKIARGTLTSHYGHARAGMSARTHRVARASATRSRRRMINIAATAASKITVAPTTAGPTSTRWRSFQDRPCAVADLCRNSSWGWP